MKPSEMTNDILANECESVAESMEKYGGKGCGVKLREAAARLRKNDKQKSINKELVDENADIRSRLKVAEDALMYARNNITRDCYSECDHVRECTSAHGSCKCIVEDKIENALAALAKASGESEVE